eukprot:SAG31_NODE_14552_length_799_cov_1.885714_1_plen_92_part_00
MVRMILAYVFALPSPPVGVLLLLLLLLLPSSGDRHLECSYQGHRTAPGRCVCEPPWLGTRCNQLPPPAGGGPRDATHYRSLFGGTGAFVAS